MPANGRWDLIRRLKVKARDARRITAAEMKYMKRREGYSRTDYKTNTQIAKELKIAPILGKLLEYKIKCIQRVNRMPRNRFPRVMKHYSPTGRRNHGRPLKRFLDTWDRNGSTSGPTPWQIHDDDDHHHHILLWEETKALEFFIVEMHLRYFVRYLVRHGQKIPGFESRQGQCILLLSKTSRSALWPNQPPL